MAQEQIRAITFIANCEICPRKNVPCRNHHFVPQRLLRTLPLELQRRWEYMKVRICNSCDKYMHPEEHLYLKIKYLEGEIEKLKNG
jgi:DNA repair photolyase